MQQVDRDFIGRQLIQTAGNRFDGTLDIGLDHHRQSVGLAFGDIREHLFERAAGASRGADFAQLRLTIGRHFARPAFTVDDDDVIARRGHTAEAENDHRRSGPGGIDRFGAIIEQRAHPAPFATGNHDVANI